MTDITVQLHVATRADTGETFVIPSEAEINEQKQLEIAQLEQTLTTRQATGEGKEISKKLRTNAVAEIDGRYSRWLEDRKVALPEARELTFKLTKPDFGQQRRAYANAQRIDFDSAQAILDSAEYQSQLLLAAFGGDTAKMDELDPVVAQELSRRVYRMSHPDQRRLPFVAGPPSLS